MITAKGQAIAFDKRKAQLALNSGGAVVQDGISLVIDAGGIKATDKDGKSLPSHQAFWFAWSQFHPETLLWAAQ